MKKIFLFILCLLVIIIVSCEVDSCDIKCDNYIDIKLRENCYQECYENNSNK